jgi:hypothetical protein
MLYTAIGAFIGYCIGYVINNNINPKMSGNASAYYPIKYLIIGSAMTVGGSVGLIFGAEQLIVHQHPFFALYDNMKNKI